MGLFGLFGGPQQSFQVQDLADRRLKAAAELVDECIGKKNDDVITKGDLTSAAKSLNKNKGAFAKLSDFERQLLSDALVKNDSNEGRMLLDFLRQENSKPRGPFATSIACAAIRDTGVHACAELIAKNFGSGETEVNLTELVQAKKSLADGKLPDGLEGSALNADNIAELELFLMTGKGGLVTHEGVNIGGKNFREAFPLPGDANSPDVIKQYDAFFEHTGYDLIFIKDAASPPQLYVVLNESGELDIKANMRVQLGRPGNYLDAGTVLAVHDVNNSFGEATWGFWTDTASGLVKGIRGKLGKNLDTQLETAAERAAKSTSTAAKPTEGGVGMSTVMAVGALGAVSGAAFSSVAGPAAVGIGVAVTGFNLIDFGKNRLGRDKSAIYHAMGVCVNQDRHIR